MKKKDANKKRFEFTIKTKTCFHKERRQNRERSLRFSTITDETLTKQTNNWKGKTKTEEHKAVDKFRWIFFDRASSSCDDVAFRRVCLCQTRLREDWSDSGELFEKVTRQVFADQLKSDGRRERPTEIGRTKEQQKTSSLYFLLETRSMPSLFDNHDIWRINNQQTKRKQNNDN